ncbi:MAG TPA: trypsin-like serine protease [Candidatus Limnocylindrales bacterium]|nr:trypsin-like serine protease [Candidatus Limnocylindrales bacterium]
MLKRITVLAAALAILLLGSVAPANAITDGALDGNGHPYVGLMVAKDAKGNPLWRCSGTLMSSKVFLTAGHCTEAPAVTAEIWFASDVQAHASQSDPSWNGYPFKGEARGKTYTHPEYDPNAFFLRDMGVVVLSKAVTMRTYGALPSVNYFDRFDSQRGQQDVSFTSVGYGLQKSFPDAASWKDQSQKIRMVAYPKLLQVNTGFVGDSSLLLSNNANTGGTCFGDSGGPNFIGSSNVVGGVTSFGINSNCAGTGGVYRVDRSWNLDWLHTFGL